MEQLTVSEINTLIEALDAWTTSSKTSKMLGGLIFGALLSRGEEDGADKGQEIFKKMNEGEEEKQKQREEIAIMLKAKLIKLRDTVEASEFANSVK